MTGVSNMDRIIALTDTQRAAALGWLGGLLEYRTATKADLDRAIDYALGQLTR